MPCSLEDKELPCLRDSVREVESKMVYLISLIGRMLNDTLEGIWTEAVAA
jgi:hypothetical protein